MILLLACDEPESSNLERLAREAQTEAAARAANDPKPKQDAEPDAPSPMPDGDPAKAGSTGGDATGPKTVLSLALVEGTKYRVTTIGMTTFPMLPKPSGFAREEDIELSECSGEGAQRRCTLTNRTRNFDAEPPLGKPIKKGEAEIADLVTSHVIEATGHRVGETKVDGPAKQRKLEQAKILAQSHRLHCLSLPNQPLAVGEGWSSTCQTRIGGQLQEHKVQWKLAKLEEDADLGLKAELHFAGEVTTADPMDPQKQRKGGIAGALYFLASHGEPHMLRQRISLVSPSGEGQRTVIDMRVQFAKVSATDDDVVLRVDGTPFPEAEAPAMPATAGKSGRTGEGGGFEAARTDPVPAQGTPTP
jgi:hypothetical protein